MKKTLLILAFTLFGYSLFSQTICNNMTRLCLELPFTYNSSGNGTGFGHGLPAEVGPNYGCIFSASNPEWFYFKVIDTGNITLNISNDMAQDIDFVCWGPYYTMDGICNNLIFPVACSFSTAATEYCEIPNAEAGQYYVLLISNYSNNPTIISITKPIGNASFACGNNEEGGIINNSPLCNGQTLHLEVAAPDAGAYYYWTGPCGFSSSQLVNDIQSISSSCDGYYVLSKIVNGLVVSSDSVHIVINQIPTVTITSIPDDTICTGVDFQLNAQGAISYHWLGINDYFDNLFLTADTTQTFTVVGYNYNCKDTVSKIIYVKGNAINLNQNTFSLCKGDSAMIIVSGGYNYLWSPPFGLSDTIADTVYARPLVSASYDVSYTDTIAGCFITKNVYIIVDSVLSTNLDSIFGNSQVCQGTQNQYGVYPNYSSATYTWYLINGDSITSVNFIYYNMYFDQTSGYLRVKASNSCNSSSITSKYISVLDAPAKPLINPSGDTTICNGASIVLTSTPSNGYYWNNNLFTQSINVNSGGSYRLRVSNISCYSPFSDIVNVIFDHFSGPLILLQNDHLHSIIQYGNNWYRNGIYTGDTNQDFYFSQLGTYCDIIKSGVCMSDPSNSVILNDVSVEEYQKDDGFDVFPNPTTSYTNIECNLNQPSKVILSVYNFMGAMITTICNEQQPAGNYKRIFNAKEFGLSAGIYFVRLSVNGKSEVKKVLLVN